MSNAKELRNDAVDAQVRRIDWQEALGEDMEGFQCFEAFECEGCDRTVVASVLGSEEHRFVECDITVTDEDGDETEEPNECEWEIHHEGPMMNFFYPVDIHDRWEAALAIKDLPLCVVVLRDGETGLALTGGGMDLSWEICEAYVKLGFLPPFEMTRLPDLAGMRLNERTIPVLEACKRSCEIIQGWAERRREQLIETWARLAGKDSLAR